MKWTPHRTAGLLTTSGLLVALLVGPAATAQAGENALPCPGGCAQSAPDGFQVSSVTAGLSTNGNWDPH